MTYEEIVRRVDTKSSICPECGCFISSLLDCCPACGYSTAISYEIAGGKAFIGDTTNSRTSLPPELKTRFDLYDSYINGEIDSMRFRDAYQALGGNSAVEKIATYDARTSSYIASLYELRAADVANSVSKLYDYAPDVGRPVTLYKDNEPFRTEYVPDVDYTAYYKAKTDALKAQQITMRLYEDAIKSMKSYSGDIEDDKEEVEYVYHYPF